MSPRNRRTEADKEQILAAYCEQATPLEVRGIACIYRIGRATVKEMLKKVHEQATVQQSLRPARADDVLELDEVWSFVLVRVFLATT